jgi:hypothetical protein
MASAAFTITIDTASSPWVKQDGTAVTISGTAETFMLYCDDLGTTGIWKGYGTTAENTVALSDGTKLYFSSDSKMVNLAELTNATARPNAGSFWVSEDGAPEVEVRVVTITTSDGDVNDGVSGTVANGLTTVTFEYPGKPWRWTWVNADLVVA